MRNRSKSGVAHGVVALIASAVFVAFTQPLAAQGGRRSGAAGAGASGCVSPLPMPMMGGPGAFGPGGRGGRGGRGASGDSTARPDSAARRRPPRGCPPFFPDSLALSASQKQQIVSLRSAFAQNHATELGQLQSIAQNAHAARQAGQTDEQVRAIMAQAAPIRKALRTPEQQVQKQVEATLSAGQLTWMKAHGRAGQRRGRIGKKASV
jgi:hypothetical protein